MPARLRCARRSKCVSAIDVHERIQLDPVPLDLRKASARYLYGRERLLPIALQKLDSWSKLIPMDASPATAHMFIIQPFTGESLMRIFSTHPSTESRIARLQAIR